MLLCIKSHSKSIIITIILLIDLFIIINNLNSANIKGRNGLLYLQWVTIAEAVDDLKKTNKLKILIKIQNQN